MKNVHYLRSLYTLLAPILIFALIWASICLYYWDSLGSVIAQHWGWGVAAGIIMVVLILVAMFISAFNHLPLNWVIYFLFFFFFAYFSAFLCCVDFSLVMYFSLWVLTVIILAFAFYTLCSPNYIPAIEAFLLAFGSALLVLIFFIVFTHIKFFWLMLAYFATSVYGFYLGYSLRTSVMYGLFDDEE